MRSGEVFGGRKMKNEDASAVRSFHGRLYHGTCKAFIVYALQNGGKFGSEYYSVSFTPSLEHAQVFAESWKTSRGLVKLRDFFSESIDGVIDELSEPIILEFNARLLGKLKYRLDCGEDEYYVERGPVDINEATLVASASSRWCLEDGK